MKPIFRNSMFGFHKEDVANFIAKQNHQYEMRLAELQAEVSDITGKYESERGVIGQLENELSGFREKKNDLCQLIEQIRSAASVLVTKKDQLCFLLEEEEKLVEGFNEGTVALQKRVEEAESYRQKANRFDQLAAVLGEIVSGKAPEVPNVPANTADRLTPVVNTDPLMDQLREQQKLLQSLQSGFDELLSILSLLEEQV